MSEKKDPNEINFDDGFLDIDFGNADLNASTDTAADVDLSAEFDEMFDQNTADVANSDIDLTVNEPVDIALSDITVTDNTTGIDLTHAGDNTAQDDFFNQLDDLNQANAPTDVANDNVDTALLGAGAVAGASVASGLGQGEPAKDKPAKKGLFGKKDGSPKTPKMTKPKAPKAPKPASGKSDLTGLLSDPQKLNKLILGGVIALALIGVALYMAMSGDESSIPDVAPAPAPVSTPAPAEETAPPTTDSTESPAPQGEGDVASDTATTPVAGDSVLPEIKPVVSPDEILNAEIPTDPALIKEEIDRLADKDSQIAEQEKLIQDQLTMMEDLTTAKAEQIALLEAQIAELENQKNSTETTAPASGH